MRLWPSRRKPAANGQVEFRIGGKSIVVPGAGGPLSPRAADAVAALQANGGVLRCAVCGSEQPLGDIGRYLAEGWPGHCGQATMKWVTQRQLEAEEKQQ